MKMKLWLSMLAAVVMLVSLRAEEIKILTIGNSFADSVFRYLPKVAESAGDKVIIDRANIGGCSLKRHWDELEKSQKDPEFKPYYKKFTLKDKLEAQQWDFVTIQQASHDSWKFDTYMPYARNLQEYVKQYAPQAELVIQQTWAYRFDDNRLRSWKIDQQRMYDELTKAYDQAAAELGIRVIPTGDAVQLARETQPVKYKPYDMDEVAKLKFPAKLPSEEGSLVAGLWWRKDPNDPNKGEFKKDASHLNKRGEYLQACVWYGFFFNKPTSNITFVPDELTAEDAAFMREVAQKALDARCK